jgi:hypothetical protein
MSEDTLSFVVGILSALAALAGAIFSYRTQKVEREADETARRAEQAHDASSSGPPSSREELVEGLSSIKLGALRRNPELTRKILSDIDELRSKRRGGEQGAVQAE